MSGPTNEPAPSADPVPPAVRETLALFANELADVRFGDLDGASLADLAETTRARARDVEHARAALDAALAELDRARTELTRRAEQGLAYAKVFAASDEALSARIAELDGQPRQARGRTGKRRKSAPKKAEESTELPFEAQAGAA